MNRRLRHDVDMTDWPVVLTTRELILRPARQNDLEWFVRLQTNGDARRYLGGPADETQLRAQLAGPLGRRWGSFVVAERRTGELVGTVSFEHAQGGLELGYVFDPEYWGRGYAQRTVPVAMRWAADQVEAAEIIAVTQTANRRSTRLLRALGFAERRRFIEFDAEQTQFCRRAEADPAPRWIRLQSPTTNGRGHHPGIFGLANHLAGSGALTDPEMVAWRAGNDWYEMNLTDPATIDPTVYDRAIHPVTAAWFAGDATELLERAEFYLDLLARHDVPVERVESEDPGQVIYRDADQVVVVPWESERPGIS